MDRENIIFLFLLLLTFFTLQTSTASQMLVSRRHLVGEWRLLHKSIGITAMHMQLLHNNKVVIFEDGFWTF
ncbi:hypothetical protein R3W88_018852 [Solanum pinnatisectum]|uniref:Uncharacterized protein n=1 Tax=Solanum pinnatisectum TaxID=50273 RepID=A0AAV9KHM6_9SOLN|nr:hypothetical protein R3W88_018852 [Solanum pinnatisectum]